MLLWSLLGCGVCYYHRLLFDCAENSLENVLSFSERIGLSKTLLSKLQRSISKYHMRLLLIFIFIYLIIFVFMYISLKC